MRTLNVRLATILLAGLILLCAGIHLLHGYQVRNNAGIYRKTADAEEKNLKEAIKSHDQAAAQKASKNFFMYLQLYVELNPADLEQRERLAFAIADSAGAGNDASGRAALMQAFGMLENLVRQSPDREAARRRVVKIAMAIGRFQDAKYHLQKYLLKKPSDQKSPQDPELQEELGQCQAGLGDYGAAVATFQKTIQIDPSRLTAYVEAASLLKGPLQRREDADALMATMVKTNSKSPDAHIFYGRYLLASAGHNELDHAIAEAQLANKLKPDAVDGLLLLSTCYLTKGQYDEARKLAARGEKLFPTNPMIYSVSADIELKDNRREQAIAILRQGTAATNRHPILMWQLTNLLVDANKIDEANRFIELMVKAKNYHKHLLDYLSARVEFAREHWLAAKDMFEQVQGALSNQAALQNTTNAAILKQSCYWAGQCYGQLGNTDQQLAAYQAALNVDPHYAPARAATADLLMRLGKYDDAIDEYHRLAVDKQITNASTLPLAEMLFMQTIQKPPAERNWKPIESLLDAAEKSIPESAAVRIPILRANICIVQNHLADAETILLNARNKHPKESAYWVALADLAERQQDWKRTERTLDDAEKTLGNTVEVRLAKSQYWVRRYGKDAKKRLHALLDDAKDLSDADLMHLWGGLLNAAIQIDDTPQGDLLCSKLAAKQPNNVRIRYLMFERALSAGNRGAMAQAAKEIETIAGQNAFWQYAQAISTFLDAEKIKTLKDATPKLQKALEYLARARELRKNWSRIPLIEANIYDRMNRQEDALARYTEAIEQGERSPIAFQRTIQILFQKQQFAKADQWLSRMERDTSIFSEDLEKAGVEIALQQGEFNRAVEKARKAVDAKSSKYQDHLWLGQILGIVGANLKDRGEEKEANVLFADAEQSLQQAVKLAPTSPAPWVALIRFLTVMQKEDKAEAAVQKASKSLPADQAALTLAQCYEIMRKPSAAKEKYDAALAASPKNVAVVRLVADFYRRTDKFAPAEDLLNKILDGQLQASDDDKQWGRRQMAFIHTARGGYANLQSAEKLIEDNIASYNSPIDRRELARIYALDPRMPLRNKAVDIFEDMVHDHSATADDRMTLVRLYLIRNDWIKASSLLRSLVADYEKDPRYLIAYAEALIQHKETSDVGLYLDRLQEIIPNTFALAGLRADLAIANKEPELAYDILLDYLHDKKSLPADRNAQRRFVSEKMAQLARNLKESKDKAIADKLRSLAESLFREFVSSNAELEILLPSFLCVNGKQEEAMDVFARVWKNASMTNVAQTAAVLLHEGSLDDKQLTRLDGIIGDACKKFERPTQLMLCQAEVATACKNYDESIEIYRDILKKEPRNAIVLNNLAVLLALQGKHLDEALKLVDQSVEIAGPVGAILDSRAIVHIAMKKPQVAIDDLTAAMADGETPVRLFHRAQACKMAGQKQEFKQALTAALNKGLTPYMLHPLERSVLDSMSKSL